VIVLRKRPTEKEKERKKERERVREGEGGRERVQLDTLDDEVRALPREDRDGNIHLMARSPCKRREHGTHGGYVSR